MATTTTANINKSAWTDLGVGPFEIQSLDVPAVLVIADTVPNLNTAGFSVGYGAQPFELNVSTHVWVKSAAGAGSVVYANITSNSGGGTSSTVNVNNFPSVQPISGVIDLRNFATSAATNVTASTSSTVVLSANVNRKRYSIFNDSTSVMYVLENASAASNTTYSYQIQPNGYFSTTEWSGEIRAIWTVANGNARVMEYLI